MTPTPIAQDGPQGRHRQPRLLLFGGEDLAQVVRGVFGSVGPVGGAHKRGAVRAGDQPEKRRQHQVRIGVGAIPETTSSSGSADSTAIEALWGVSASGRGTRTGTARIFITVSADGLARTAALTQLLDLLAFGSTTTSGTANLTPFEISFFGWGVPI